jgi:hypothetical protein
MRRRPQVVAGARANRAFLARAVRYLAGECGIRQFLDIGTGLPAPGSTHQIAQEIAPDSRIVYVDSDPLVLAYARALLVPTPLIPRSHSQVSALIAGLPLVPPGVVPLAEWRPAAGPFPHATDLYAGVAHAPAPRS